MAEQRSPRKAQTARSALPAVQYGYVLKQNRRDNGSAASPMIAGNSSLTMPRINQITDPLGGVTAFTYDQSHQCPIVSSGFVRFPYDCFITWNPAVSGFSIFNKWKVMSVTVSDSFSGSPAQTITYSYSTPINHYDDDPVTPSSQKSWGDFRGQRGRDGDRRLRRQDRAPLLPRHERRLHLERHDLHHPERRQHARG